MLAHHVGRVGHHLHGVQGAPPVPGIQGAVRRLAVELDDEVVERLSAVVEHPSLGARVPVEGGVEAVEDAVAGHVGLPHQRLLGRRAEELDRAGKRLPWRTRFKATAAPTLAAPNRLWPQPWPSFTPSLRSSRRGHRLVADPRKRVELGEDPHHGPAAAEHGHEGGGHARDAPLHREAFLLEDVREDGSRALLLERGLGDLPELPGHPADLGGEALGLRDHRGLRLRHGDRARWGGRAGQRDEDEGSGKSHGTSESDEA